MERDRWLATSAFEATADPVVQSVGAALRQLVPRTCATIPPPVLMPDQCGAGVVDFNSFETRRAFPRRRPRRRLGGTSPCLRCFLGYLRWAAGPAFRAQTAPDVEAPHRRPRLAAHAVLRGQAFFAFAHVADDSCANRLATHERRITDHRDGTAQPTDSGVVARSIVCVARLQFVETDADGRVTLPGHARTRFLLRENADGSILLQPAHVLTEAQYEYDATPELRELLSAATSSKTVRRTRHQLS